MKSKYNLLKIIILLLFLFAATGCGSTMIILLEDGKPLPTYAYGLSNPASGLSIEVMAANYTVIDEEGEEVLWPVYLNVGRTHRIDPKKSRYVRISIKIRNPNKVWYVLSEKSIRTPLTGKGKSKISSKKIYEGRLRYNGFELFRLIEDNMMEKVDIEVKGKGGLPLFNIGSFSYKMVRPNYGSSERGDAG